MAQRKKQRRAASSRGHAPRVSRQDPHPERLLPPAETEEDVLDVVDFQETSDRNFKVSPGLEDQFNDLMDAEEVPEPGREEE